MATRRKLNCWEQMECGLADQCPASTDAVCNGLNGGASAGRICWAVAGIYGEGQNKKGRLACLRCSFRTQVAFEEGSEFVPFIKKFPKSEGP